MSQKFINWFIIGTMVGLYALVSLISTIHSIEFFRLTNTESLSITLAIAFELGSAASMASIIILDKTNRILIWMLFIILTVFQSMANAYYSYAHATDYLNWMELFGLNNESDIVQKRILALISGSLLPVVSLGFIKSLVDYINPKTEDDLDDSTTDNDIVISDAKGESDNSEYIVRDEFQDKEPNNEHVQQDIVNDITDEEGITEEQTIDSPVLETNPLAATGRYAITDRIDKINNSKINENEINKWQVAMTNNMQV